MPVEQCYVSVIIEHVTAIKQHQTIRPFKKQGIHLQVHREIKVKENVELQ